MNFGFHSISSVAIAHNTEGYTVEFHRPLKTDKPYRISSIDATHIRNLCERKHPSLVKAFFISNGMEIVYYF